jgi:hypothetical protein
LNFVGNFEMNKLNRFGYYLIITVTVFASSFAKADWYVKDAQLARILAKEATIDKVRVAVQNTETAVGQGTKTDNVNTKLHTINENITKLTNQFSFNKKTFPTYEASNYLGQFRKVTAAISTIKTETVFITPKLKCNDLTLKDTKNDKGDVGLSMFGTAGEAASFAGKATLLLLKNGNGFNNKAYENLKELNTACENINTLVAEMYKEANSFNSQIYAIQEKINSYKDSIKPKAPATSAGSSSSSTAGENKTDSYADLAMISLELQIIQASQANIIGVHASNAAMFKFQIQAAKELYLKLSVKRMLG